MTSFIRFMKAHGYSQEINVPRLIIKPLLWFTHFFSDNNLVLVCKGYGDDYEMYTGLYWQDDKSIDFSEKCYEDFQLWLWLIYEE